MAAMNGGNINMSSGSYVYAAARKSRKSRSAIPLKNTIIYDAACPICGLMTDVIKKRDKNSKLKFIGSIDIENIDRGILAKTVVFIDDNGDTVYRSAAISRVLKQMSGVWRLVGIILSLPIISQLGDFVYRLFSRHRRWLSGTAIADRVRRDL